MMLPLTIAWGELFASYSIFLEVSILPGEILVCEVRLVLLRSLQLPGIISVCELLGFFILVIAIPQFILHDRYDKCMAEE